MKLNQFLPTRPALLVVAVAVAVGVSTPQFSIAAEDAPTAQVEGGAIRGTVENGVHTFRGIPFAAPPVGELRWQPPQPVQAWEGVRDCSEFGPACPQAPYPAASLYARDPEPMSEDCLYLNVWTTSADEEKPKPVMVWIHGGALTRGSGSRPTYDGAALAKKGVVLVTINYRLNVFGYFAHPDLSEESDRNVSGNYGVLDQVAALEWVQQNIAAFGGDPDRVTIFGESAGSWSVNALMATPLAAGLFHRAIGQSGAAFGPGYFLRENPAGGTTAEQNGAEFAKSAGATSLAELRAIPAERLVELQASNPDDVSFRTRPNVDGYVLPDEVRQIFLAGKQNDVPLIVGSNRDEMTSLTSPAQVPKTLTALKAWATSTAADHVDELLDLYGATTDADAAKAFLNGVRDRGFSLGMRTWARMCQTGESNVYLYFFTRVPPIPNSDYFGAFHACEIAYAFNNVSSTMPTATDTDLRLADAMSDYWVRFAATGDPNAASDSDNAPHWSTYDPDNEPYLEFGESIQTGNHLLKPELDFWESLTTADR